MFLWLVSDTSQLFLLKSPFLFTGFQDPFSYKIEFYGLFGDLKSLSLSLSLNLISTLYEDPPVHFLKVSSLIIWGSEWYMLAPFSLLSESRVTILN